VSERSLRRLIVDRIRRDGPMTWAEYMEWSLYHPVLGYYATAPRRSGRAGDFVTSVDAGPLFGALLADQFADMWRASAASGAAGADRPAPFDLVEAGAADGRLARDVLDAAASHPNFYHAIRLTLVERGHAGRAVHGATLGPHAGRLAASLPDLPGSIEGILYANELLDAMPVHVLAMTRQGLREVFVDEREGRLIERVGGLSDPALGERLDGAAERLQPGWRVEVGVAARSWVQQAARRIRRGFMLLIDYGHEARDLYSATCARGTLASFKRHRTSGAVAGQPLPLNEPGEHDLTAHVNLTDVRLAAEAEGLTTLGILDQTYFLLGLGLGERLAGEYGGGLDTLKHRLALKTLIMPGGLGSTHKVLIFARGVGRPALRGCSGASRLT
jgi:SAM-dependent MidA family methyltransferase